MAENKDVILGTGSIVYTSSEPDENAVRLISETRNISDVSIIKSGNSDSTDGSNAAAYIGNEGQLNMDNSEIIDDASYSDGIYAVTGGVVSLDTVRFEMTGENSSGIYNNGGSVNGNALNIGISGSNCGAVSNIDGTTVVTESTLNSTGNGSALKVEGGNISLVRSTLKSMSTTMELDGGSTVLVSSTVDHRTDNPAIEFKGSGALLDLNAATLNTTSESGYLIKADAGTGTINVDPNSLFNTTKFGNITNESSIIVNLDDVDLATRNVAMNFNVDETSTLELNVVGVSVYYGAINSSKQAGTVKVKLGNNAVWKLSATTRISDLELDYESVIDLNGHLLFVDGEAFTNEVTIGSVVHYLDESNPQRNCIVVRKDTDEENSVTTFVLYDADDHVTYSVTSDMFRDTHKRVDKAQLNTYLREIESLLDGIDYYHSNGIERSKYSDVNALLVDGESEFNYDVTLEGMTIYKSGDASSSTTGREGKNSTILVINSGLLDLSDSNVSSISTYSDGVRTTANSYSKFTNVSIDTTGQHAVGIYASASNNDMENVTVHTHNINSEALYSEISGALTVKDSTVTADRSLAAVVSDGGNIILNGTTVNAESDLGGIQVSGNSSNLSVFNSTVNVNSEEAAYGFKSTAYNQSNLNEIILTNSTINYNSENPIIDVDPVTLNLTISNMIFVNPKNAALARVRDGSVLNIEIKDQTTPLQGNLLCSADSELNVVISGDGTVWEGSINSTGQSGNVNVIVAEGAVWKLTADTYVTSFSRYKPQSEVDTSSDEDDEEEDDEIDDTVTDDEDDNTEGDDGDSDEGDEEEIDDEYPQPEDFGRIDLNGFTLYVNGDIYVEEFNDNDDYDEEEEKLVPKTLFVGTAADIPIPSEQNHDYIYLAYDQMRIWINGQILTDPFAIIDEVESGEMEEDYEEPLEPENGGESGGEETPTEPSEGGDNPENPEEPTEPVEPGDGDESGEEGGDGDSQPVIPSNGTITEEMIGFRMVEDMLYISTNGYMFIKHDYQIKKIGEVEKDEEGDPNEDMLDMLANIGTFYYMNAESRYLDKQTKQLMLPYQNGNYQLSVNLPDDIVINDHTIIAYNPKTNQWEISGDKVVQDGETLVGLGKYKGYQTSTIKTTVDDGLIRGYVRVNEASSNAIKATKHGLYFDGRAYALAKDFNALTSAYTQYRAVIDRYIVQLRDAVQQVTGSVSDATIYEKMIATLTEYESTIEAMKARYDDILSRTDTLEYDLYDGLDERINAAKQEIIDYIEQISSAWEHLEPDSYAPEIPDGELTSLNAELLKAAREKIKEVRNYQNRRMIILESTDDLPESGNGDTDFWVYNSEDRTFTRYEWDGYWEPETEEFVGDFYPVETTEPYAVVDESLGDGSDDEIIEDSGDPDSDPDSGEDPGETDPGETGGDPDSGADDPEEGEDPTDDDPDWYSYWNSADNNRGSNGLTAQETEAVDNILADGRKIYDTCNSFVMLNHHSELPEAGVEGATYFISEHDDVDFYVYDTDIEKYQDYRYNPYTDSFTVDDSKEVDTLEEVTDSLFQIYVWNTETESFDIELDLYGQGVNGEVEDDDESDIVPPEIPDEGGEDEPIDPDNPGGGDEPVEPENPGDGGEGEQTNEGGNEENPENPDSGSSEEPSEEPGDTPSDTGSGEEPEEPSGEPEEP